jgi:hypothetical protein
MPRELDHDRSKVTPIFGEPDSDSYIWTDRRGRVHVSYAKHVETMLREIGGQVLDVEGYLKDRTYAQHSELSNPDWLRVIDFIVKRLLSARRALERRVVRSQFARRPGAAPRGK